MDLARHTYTAHTLISHPPALPTRYASYSVTSCMVVLGGRPDSKPVATGLTRSRWPPASKALATRHGRGREGCGGRVGGRRSRLATPIPLAERCMRERAREGSAAAVAVARPHSSGCMRERCARARCVHASGAPRVHASGAPCVHASGAPCVHASGAQRVTPRRLKLCARASSCSAVSAISSESAWVRVRVRVRARVRVRMVPSARSRPSRPLVCAAELI